MVGGGLAGAAAAMRLRERGFEVLLASRSSGATALGGGTFDFSATPQSNPPRTAEAAGPAARMAALLVRNPSHPYHGLVEGGDCAVAFEMGVRALDRWVGREGLGIEGRSDRSLALADTQGAPRIADAAVATIAAGDLEECTEVGVVALPGLRGWNAGAVARRLGAEAAASGAALRAVRLDPRWPDAWLEAGEVPARLAALLDAPGALPALSEALRSEAASGRLLLLPPVLGLDPQNPLREALAQALGVPVAECVGVAPLLVAGVRVQTALERALDRAGVERLRVDVRSLDLDPEDQSIALTVAAEVGGDGGAPDGAADAQERFSLVVIATGRFVGGGIREGPAGLEETLLGLPLWDPKTGARVDGVAAQTLSAPAYEEAQPLYRIGVACDADGRPLGDSGPISRRLFVAGELIAGFDPALDRSGHGVALLSGLKVAETAARAFRADADRGSVS